MPIDFEILINDAKMAKRGHHHLDALLKAGSEFAVASKGYTGKYPNLMMYGAGLASRTEARRAHLKRGGRVVIWDLGYWERDDHLRLSIDSLHPTDQQLGSCPNRSRFRIPCTNTADLANGPIMLVGLGLKSTALYGLSYLQWEKAKLAELRRRYPGRTILWRPKGRDVSRLPGTQLCSGGVPIEEALVGCSLVVCRHSNVAVDACRQGIPVETDDGAARTLYEGNPNPTVEERTEFLRRLGWWNWGHNEAWEAWQWIRVSLQSK